MKRVCGVIIHRTAPGLAEATKPKIINSVDEDYRRPAKTSTETSSAVGSGET